MSAELALSVALNEATRSRIGVVTTPHLFIGLTKVDGGVTQKLLTQFGVRPKRLRDYFRNIVATGNADPGEKPAITSRFAKILSIAEEKAGMDQHPTIEEVHLLWAILKDGMSDKDSITIRALKKCRLDPHKLMDIIESGENLEDSNLKSTHFLDSLGRNLTHLAKGGKLSPVIGRDEEIGRLIQVLSRKTKNTPVLIGEAGVGKTAIVEGLAQRVVAGQMPADLKEIRIVEVSVSSIVAGTKYRGDFEERLQKIIDEARQDINTVLFIDEMHTLMGAGESMNGTLDAANILKPALARGEIRCIGATTTSEYRKYIERDSALERRLQPITVREPEPAECLTMLRGAKHRFEEHHNVEIDDRALEAAIDLSTKYITDRHLPDKAFDLIDEACAETRLRVGAERQSTDETIISAPVRVGPEDVAKAVSQWKGVPVGEFKDGEEKPASQFRGATEGTNNRAGQSGNRASRSHPGRSFRIKRVRKAHRSLFISRSHRCWENSPCQGTG